MCVTRALKDGERPVAWINRPVTYAVNGNIVDVKQPAGLTLAVSNAPNIAMAAIGSDAADVPDAYSPLVLDLNKNGKFDLSAATEKSPAFDMTATGKKQRMGWVQKTDGFHRPRSQRE